MPFDRHSFWKNPGAPQHVDAYGKDVIERLLPENTLDLANVTRLVVDTIQKYVAIPQWSILELGSGTGRNLAGLAKAGYSKLGGVEINPDAVKLGLKHFPELASIPVQIAPVEQMIKTVSDTDVIFTQGFLMLLPPDHEWVITEIAKKARHLIVTIEGERPASFHVWPHDYKQLIEAAGWNQVEAHTCEAWPPLPSTTVLRVFEPNIMVPVKSSPVYEIAPNSGTGNKA